MKIKLELEEGEVNEFSQTVREWIITKNILVSSPAALFVLFGELVSEMVDHIHYMKE